MADTTTTQQQQPIQTPIPAPGANDNAGMLTDWYKSYMSKAPTTASFTPSTAGASGWSVDENSTVQGQLAKVLDKGGPLMDRATTAAKQGMAGRGLINSSIAIGAGQSALYDAATPIATADANTFAQAGKTNAELGTQVSIANAGFANDAGKFNAGAVNDANTQLRAAGVSSFQQQQNITADKEKQAADIASQQAMQKIGITSQQEMQSRDILNQLSMQSNALSSQDKLQARDLAVQQLMQQAGFTQQQALQAVDIANQRAMQQTDIGSRYDLATLDVNSRAALQAADAANQQALQKANAVLQTGLQATDNAVKESMQKYQLGVQQAMQGLDNENKLKLATLDASNQTALAELNNKFKVQLQAGSSMAASYQSMVDGITRIMVDPNLDVEGKHASVENLRVLYNNTLIMQSELTGLDLGTLLSGEAFWARGNATGSGSNGATTGGANGSSGYGGPGASPDPNDPSWVLDETGTRWVRAGDYGAGGG